MANRRFYFFFIEIWPQELLLRRGPSGYGGVRSVPLITPRRSVGPWCGYTCPQTVWVDLFLVARTRHRGRPQPGRMKLEDAPWSVSKLSKRVLKHAVWIMIGVATGGAWIF